MRIYVSSNFYDYTHIVIYFLIIRKYYNPIFYDYAHILQSHMYMLFLISYHKSYLIISEKHFILYTVLLIFWNLRQYIIYSADSKRILNLFTGRLLYVNEY